VGKPASVQQVSSKCPASGQQTHADPFCRLVTRAQEHMRGLGAGSCPARLLLTLKFQPKRPPWAPLGWLALAGGNEAAAGRGQFWRDTHEIKSCVPPEVTRSSTPSDNTPPGTCYLSQCRVCSACMFCCPSWTQLKDNSLTHVQLLHPARHSRDSRDSPRY
jgi:hypothetical protein